MKNILVPTDFSDCAQNAAKVAVEIAAKLNARIHFLHIMPNVEAEPIHVPNATEKVVKNTAKSYALNELNVLTAQATKSGVTATPLLVFDKTGESIEMYCEPLNIDLIVMGSHGATGIREWVIGSNTQKVIRHATVPVLVIKNTITNEFKAANIVFASNFNEEITTPIETVAKLARLWKSTVHMLFINYIDKKTDQQLIDSFSKKMKERFPDVLFTTNTAESNNEEFGIHQFSEMVDANLIAITTHDKTGFIVRHSVAEDLVNHEVAPVLVICGAH